MTTLTGGLNVLRNGASFSADGSPMSRNDKAHLAIEGTPPGFFGTEWRPIRTFDAAFTRQIEAEGGQALALAMSDPFDVTRDNERLALLWDDQVVAAGPINFEEGDLVQVRIGPPKGAILSIWCTDGNVAAKVVDAAPASQASALAKRVEEKEAAEKHRENLKPNPFTEALEKFFEAQTKVGIAAVVVGGVVLYFWLKK
jgi:hypothetical protein